MNIQNKQIIKTAIASTTILLSLAMTSTVSANKGGYVSDGNGNVVRDGFGGCVKAGAGGKAFAECEEILAAGPISAPPPPPVPVAVFVPPVPVKVVVPPKPIVKPKPKPTPKPQPVMITKTLTLNEAAGANFGFDNSSLSNNAQQQLTTFANTVRNSSISPSSVSVVGHTDSTGPEKYNQTLSVKRANSVANYLSNQGIARSAMQVSGRGETQPVASNKTRDGRAQNRRVDIRVTGQRTITVKQ